MVRLPHHTLGNVQACLRKYTEPTSSAASCCSMRVMPLPSASFSSTVSMKASSCSSQPGEYVEAFHGGK